MKSFCEITLLSSHASPLLTQKSPSVVRELTDDSRQEAPQELKVGEGSEKGETMWAA